jgi:hypothetical protein
MKNGKRLELLREVVPRLHRLAIMVDFNPQLVLEMGEVQAAARKPGRWCDRGDRTLGAKFSCPMRETRHGKAGSEGR